jgi:N-acetylmuramoyl-L-alanine amidase
MKHTVAQGECLASIAHRYGFADFHAIYDHPENAAFKRRRPNPDVIRPGDRITIPDKDVKQVPIATGAEHAFVVKRQRRKLHLVFQDDAGTPFADMPYRLSAPGFERRGTTPGDGSIEADVPMNLTDLQLEIGHLKRHLHLAHLDPAWDPETDEAIPAGVQARLQHLGYDPGPIDGVIGPRTRRALRAYQRARKLPVSDLTPALAKRLESDHGA